MRFYILLAGVLGLVACASSEPVTGDPQAAAALRAQPATQYAATVALAQTVANRCAIYQYNLPLGRVVDEQRTAQGIGLATARTQVAAVDLETDIATRNLLARYEVEALEGPDVCAVAAGEVARQSALGALLVRI